MKMKHYALGLLVSISSLSILQAQTVDEVINKHVEAVGGKEKLNQVKSAYFESTMEAMGNQSPTVENLVEGKAFKSETDFQGAKIIQVYTDQSGWQVNPMAGVAGAEAMPETMYKSGRDRIYIGGGLVDYAAKGYKAELVGQENGAYKIKLTKGSDEFIYFVDTATYYLTKTIVKGDMMGQPVDITSTYSDFKKTDFGIVVPFSKEIDLGGFVLTSKLNKVEVNKEIDPKIFEMPK